ncbi:hypothetical protein D3C71_1602200 [compost metagenome]
MVRRSHSTMEDSVSIPAVKYLMWDGEMERATPEPYQEASAPVSPTIRPLIRSVLFWRSWLTVPDKEVNIIAARAVPMAV